MDMIGHPSNPDRRHFVLARDSTKVRPEPLLKANRHQWAAFFGAENTMMVRTDVGHEGIQPSLRDSGNREIVVPNLERLGYCRISLREKCARTVAGRYPRVAGRPGARHRASQ